MRPDVCSSIYRQGLTSGPLGAAAAATGRTLEYKKTRQTGTNNYPQVSARLHLTYLQKATASPKRPQPDKLMDHPRAM